MQYYEQMFDNNDLFDEDFPWIEEDMDFGIDVPTDNEEV